MKYDVVIIGAGAAGLMCAMTAGKRGKSVLLLEHNAQVGRKILISGGGRCNFTNRIVESSNFFSKNPHFSKSALSRYAPSDFIDLIDQYSIPYFEKTLGQLFCEKSAKDIIKVLLKECEKSKVEITTNTKVEEVKKLEDGFEIKCTSKTYSADKLVVATGGLSISQIGATDFGHQLAKKFGLKLTETRPALVPLTYKGFSDLSGISLPCKIKVGKIEFEEAILFTHKGLSGPAVLQASLYWNPNQEVIIDFLPNKSMVELLNTLKKTKGNQSIEKLLKDYFPNRFLDRWCKEFLKDPSLSLSNQKKDEINWFSKNINSWTITPDGTEGYRKAEVTRGGVQVDELSSKNMQAKKVEGLYFIGEVVDVTGWLGGYNFHWAWASGFVAGGDI